MPSILLLGHGELGTAILSALLAHPSYTTSPDKHRISILLRASSIPALPPSITRINANLASASESSLAEIFKGFDIVIGCTGMALPAGSQMKIARAVLAANVPRYLPWQFGVDYDILGRTSAQDLFAEQLDVREMLRAQGKTRWVVLSVGMFMPFLFTNAFGVVTKINGPGNEPDGNTMWRVKALGSWDNLVTVTSVEDIGRLVAELVFVRTQVEGVVFAKGETVSYARLLEVMREEVGRDRVEGAVWTTEMLEKELEDEPGNGLRKYRVVFADGRGVSWGEGVEGEWGVSMMGVGEWVRGNLK